jgi:hypothetical protein
MMDTTGCKRRIAIAVMALLFPSFVWSGLASAADGTPAAAPAGDQPTADCIAAYASQGIGKAGDACVIFVHAAAETPEIDIYVDDMKVVEAKPLSTSANIEQSPLAFSAGKHRFLATAAGDSPDNKIVRSTIELVAGQAYDVVVFGTLAEMRIRAYPADLSPMADGAARMRYIHASPVIGTVDVRFVPAGEGHGDPVTVTNVKYGRASDDVELADQAETSAIFLETVPAGSAFDDAVGSQKAASPNSVYTYILIGADIGNNTIYRYAFTRFLLPTSS